MNSVTSRDGTRIVYDRQGHGPALVLVDGAMCTRRTALKPELMRLLAARYTVYSYDRRGRGDSGDTPPYAVQREIEDIAALACDGGGTAYLYGHSSGACLAFEATVRLGGQIAGLAMYEPPYHVDPLAQRHWHAYVTGLRAALADGRRSDAVALFLLYTGLPAGHLAVLRGSPAWAALEAIAPTLAYDHAGILGPDAAVPAARAAQLACPVLVLHGGASFPFLAGAARAVSQAIPGARLVTLPGQGHAADPQLLARALTGFFPA